MALLTEVLADATFATPLLIGIVGSGGFVGAAVALVKLRGDNTTAAVAQAQGANETLTEVLAAVERQRDYERKRADDLEIAYRRLLDEVRRFGATDRI